VDVPDAFYFKSPQQSAGAVAFDATSDDVAALQRVFNVLVHTWQLAVMALPSNHGVTELPDWNVDEKAKQCALCTAAFDSGAVAAVTRRHCRVCCFSFCSDCCLKRIDVAKFDMTHARVCYVCYAGMQALHEPMPLVAAIAARRTAAAAAAAAAE
jgi:hypothetical protein